ncbi:MAG: hypothetical protein KOO62_06805 [candidate division Zixibacteria bacterium]|nr:hypothetical protein [candidate division Zixibacteria bacterium]
MIRILISSLLAVLLFCGIAVSEESTDSVSSFEAYRPIGEMRIWSFLLQDSTLGQLRSQVVRKVSVDGTPGFVLREHLHLDYNCVGSPRIIDVQGEHFVGDKGNYLGDDLEIVVGDQTERFVLERDGDFVEGYHSRGGEKIDLSYAVANQTMAIENYFIDQYELYFAMRNLQVGDQIDDSIFVPQSGLMARLKGEVINFSWQRLHSNLLDSVFVVRLTEPQAQELFINRDRRLLKLYVPTQKMRVYLDVVQLQPPSQAAKSSFTLGKFIALLPHYLVYIFAAIVAVLLIVGGDIRRKLLAYAAFVGLASVVIIAWVQIPIQEFLLSFFHRAETSNRPPGYLWLLLGMLPAGLIQEGIKTQGTLLFSRVREVSVRMRVMIGAGLGCGLGLAEAIYLASLLPTTDLFSWGLLERFAMIAFHTTTGALIGHATGGGQRRLMIVFGLMALANTILRTMPYLVQQSIVVAPVVHLALAVVVLIFLSGVVLYLKKSIQ